MEILDFCAKSKNPKGNRNAPRAEARGWGGLCTCELNLFDIKVCIYKQKENSLNVTLNPFKRKQMYVAC